MRNAYPRHPAPTKNWYLLNISGRPDRFFKDTRVKQEVWMKPVRSLPQVIEMLQKLLKFRIVYDFGVALTRIDADLLISQQC